MKLSKDQVRMIKALAIWPVTFIIVKLLLALIQSRPIDWPDIIIALIVTLVIGLLLVLGSRIPNNKK